ncbi:MAG: type II toxin-antitoxin system RelE/ParE family toxin [Treponema sp.]|nr:type II toxin-antitoxin system RelE/ParE family toxin [Treponema sp.]
MTYTVRFSPFAKEDKETIRNYLSKFYPETPHRFTILLKEQIANLKGNPYIYPEYSENTVYRRMNVGNYIVFYKINDQEKLIDIYRILRASWDLPKYM